MRKKLYTASETVEISNSDPIYADGIVSRISTLRGYKVMLDNELALLYGVTTKRLKEQVKRNIDRFPEDFAFMLSWDEVTLLRSQIATLKTNEDSAPAQPNADKRGKHVKHRPYAFTEQGIAMLSSVLNSKRAIRVNIAIMRAFVKIRQFMALNSDILQKLSELEHKIGQHDQDIISLFSAINRILKDESKPKGTFGFF